MLAPCFWWHFDQWSPSVFGSRCQPKIRPTYFFPLGTSAQICAHALSPMLVPSCVTGNTQPIQIWIHWIWQRLGIYHVVKKQKKYAKRTVFCVHRRSTLLCRLGWPRNHTKKRKPRGLPFSVLFFKKYTKRTVPFVFDPLTRNRGDGSRLLS